MMLVYVVTALLWVVALFTVTIVDDYLKSRLNSGLGRKEDVNRVVIIK